MVRSRGSFVWVVVVVVAVLAVVVPPSRWATADAAYLNPRMVRTAVVPGRILDVDATRVLYLDTPAAPDSAPRLRIWSRSTNRLAATVPTVPVLPDRQDRQVNDQHALLTPRGALFAVSRPGGPVGESHLIEWSGGPDVTDLGTLSPDSLRVSAPFAIWIGGETGTALYRRDLRTGRTIDITAATHTPAGSNDGDDVTSDGDVLFSSDMDVMRYRDGAVEQLTSDNAGCYPMTDGTNVLYVPTCSSSDNAGLSLNDGTRTVTLVDGNGPDILAFQANRGDRHPGFAVAGGWVAYRTWNRTNHATRLWRRAPDGTVREIAASATLTLLTLTGSGAVTYLNAEGQLRLTEPTGSAVLLATGVTWAATTDRPHAFGGAWQPDDRPALALDGGLYLLSDATLVRLTLTVVGHGTVTVGPYPQACRAHCEITLSTGTLLTLWPVADLPGWRFTGWTTTACPGADLGACGVRLDADTTVTATFQAADTTAPTMTTPTPRLPAGRHLTAGVPAEVPVTVAWTAADPDDGLAASELQVSVSGGGYIPVSLPSESATGADLTTAVGATYQLRVRGTDQHDNTSDWVEGQPFTVLGEQETTATLQGDWEPNRSPDAWGGTTVTARQAHATASFTVQGTQVALVGLTGPEHGTISVQLDDHSLGTINTSGADTRARQVLTTLNISPSHSHTLRVTTDSPAPVELDGIVVLR